MVKKRGWPEWRYDRIWATMGMIDRPVLEPGEEEGGRVNPSSKGSWRKWG